MPKKCKRTGKFRSKECVCREETLMAIRSQTMLFTCLLLVAAAAVIVYG